MTPGVCRSFVSGGNKCQHVLAKVAGMLGLPNTIEACLFDLDGVLTQTAKVHAAAWKLMFDEYLSGYAAAQGQAFVEFDVQADYATYVDGKPRVDGTRSFLNSRGIRLPLGQPDDPPTAETLIGLGNRKNELVLKMIRDQGVQPYDGSVRYVHAVRDAKLRRAVVSSSTNCREVLASANLLDLFDVIVDGQVAERDHLDGKPSPDTFLAAAAAIGVPPTAAAVFEDALAGVEAGRRGGFGFVVGVDRIGQADALQNHGASIVVEDLSELLTER